SVTPKYNPSYTLDYDAICYMKDKIYDLILYTSILTKEIIFACRYECHPSTPIPNARFSTANLYARFICLNAARNSSSSESLIDSKSEINSLMTASKK